MLSRGRRLSVLSVVVALVLAVVSVVGFLLTQHSDQQQERSLLVGNASQASLYVASVFSGIQAPLDSMAAAVSSGQVTAATFAQRAAPLAKGSVSLALAVRQGSRYVVDLHAGKLFHAGQVLDPATSTALASAASAMVALPVVFGGSISTAGFAVGPPAVPDGEALIFEFSLAPFVKSPVTSAKAFSSLTVALYGSPVARSGSLLVATTSRLPIPGDTVTEHPIVGGQRWTLVAGARGHLIGGFAAAAPLVVLVLGLIIALMVGGTVEALDRRRQFADAMVQARTADLHQSLTELREAQSALVRGERLTALGEMATVVGHELRNPLAAVTNALYLLRRQLGEPVDAAYAKHLAMAERETAKAAALAEDLTAFVRPRTPAMSDVALVDLVHEVTEAAPPPSGVELQLDVDAVELHVDRGQFSEILTNLVTNAYQAVGDQGTVSVRASRSSEGTVITVEDSGPGIDDAAAAERLFEPFFTTKHDGTGLGLAIVRRLVEAHQGSVHFENVQPHGARLVVELPSAVTAVGAGQPVPA